MLEKYICTNCLRKGIECEWDKGGQGNSESHFSFDFDFDSKMTTGKSCQPCQKQKIQCVLGGSGPLMSKRALTELTNTLRAEARACGGDQGPQETRGLPLSKKELFIPCMYGQTYGDSCLGDGEVKGG